MTNCSMQKKIESFKKNEVAGTPETKEDLIAAVEKIRDGWWTLIMGMGDFDTGPFGDMLNDVFNGKPSVSIYPEVWGSSFDEIPMDEWADAFIKQIKDYKE